MLPTLIFDQGEYYSSIRLLNFSPQQSAAHSGAWARSQRVLLFSAGSVGERPDACLAYVGRIIGPAQIFESSFAGFKLVCSAIFRKKNSFALPTKVHPTFFKKLEVFRF
jgi:hypothetical protein